MLQNPYMAWAREDRAVAVSYAPDMDWSRDLGPFVSDRLCLGLVELSGNRFPAKAVPEWRYVADYGKLLRESPSIDANEVEALTACVRSFLLYYPGRSVRVHIPWCENDYQIDVGTPEGVEEYKRIMDRAAELGVTHLLYTPANSQLSRLEDNADSWGWENVLWFGLGQKLRKGVGPPARRGPGRAQGHARLRRVEEPQAHGLRLSVAALPPGFAMDSLGRRGRIQVRRPTRACAPFRTGGWTSFWASCGRQAPPASPSTTGGSPWTRPRASTPNGTAPGASSKACAARPSTPSSTAASSTRTSVPGPGWPGPTPTRP